jgi:FlaA1/EpsC-like NDP-sugar epimerase
VCLVDGSRGSIGSALARTIIRRGPRSLILLDHSEGNLQKINFERSVLPGSSVLSPIVGDTCDGPLLSEIFEERKPETIIYAAAFKHVPLMENSLIPAVRNNALATCLLAEKARMHDVTTFVMVSTDKAVSPHSVMGASKRCAELALLRWSSPGSPMRAARLGNVLGSQGSVVPIFSSPDLEGRACDSNPSPCGSIFPNSKWCTRTDSSGCQASMGKDVYSFLIPVNQFGFWIWRRGSSLKLDLSLRSKSR